MPVPCPPRSFAAPGATDQCACEVAPLAARVCAARLQRPRYCTERPLHPLVPTTALCSRKQFASLPRSLLSFCSLQAAALPCCRLPVGHAYPASVPCSRCSCSPPPFLCCSPCLFYTLS